jgi:hypothetical protein
MESKAMEKLFRGQLKLARGLLILLQGHERKGIAMKVKKGSLFTPICLLILVAVSPPLVFAQDQPAATQFQQEELDQMLAPIALYPDSLLAQILMAATYPLEVAQAEQWAKANKNLGPDRFNDALDQRNWDPSVKALVPFPQVLSMMSDNLEWTQNLGDAFLNQQDEVMDTVQELRSKAETAGNLKDTEEQKVIAEGNDIEIEPADPGEVYVPVYDPAVIYGPWWYPDFPPFYFPPPSWIVIAFRGRIGFGKGIAVGRAWDHGWGRWDWRSHHIHVNIDRNININRNITLNRTNIQTTQWQHDPSHRKGVSYGNAATRQRYGQSVRGAENRRDFRGFEIRPQQAPVAPRPTIPQRGSRQTPAVSQQGLDRSRDRSAFGSMDHGSVVQKQSDRGRQSRQSSPSKGTGTVNRGNVGGRR